MPSASKAAPSHSKEDWQLAQWDDADPDVPISFVEYCLDNFEKKTQEGPQALDNWFDTLISSVSAVFVAMNAGSYCPELHKQFDKKRLRRSLQGFFGRDFRFDDPRIPAPDAFRAHVCLGILRALYPFIRCHLDLAIKCGSDGSQYVKSTIGLLSLVPGMSLNKAVEKRIACDSTFLANVVEFTKSTFHQWDKFELTAMGYDVVSEILASACLWEPAVFRSIFADRPCSMAEQELAHLVAFGKSLSSSTHSDESTMLDFVIATVDGEPGSEQAKRAATMRKIGKEITRHKLTTDSCDACLKEESADCKLKKCAGCGYARYCSVECQTEDWKSGLHKAQCKIVD